MSSRPTSALILFGHGARDPEWARPIEFARQRIEALRPDAVVRCAFLEFMAPTLPDVVAQLCSERATRITVLPMFIAQGGHLKRELPAMIETLAGNYPNCQFNLAPAVGESPAVLAAMASTAVNYLEGGS